MLTAQSLKGILVCSILTLFFMVVSTEAMARGGGPAGGGGGGYGGGRSGGIRSAPPGNYRIRRSHDSYYRPARESGLPPRPVSPAPDSPSKSTRPQSDPPASMTGRNPSRTPEGGGIKYRNITEKYDKLRKARHQEYWEQQRRQQP